MHILRSRALESVARDETPMPEDAKYDVRAGVWRGDSGLLAYDVKQESITKKNDVETGEDQMGQ